MTGYALFKMGRGIHAAMLIFAAASGFVAAYFVGWPWLEPHVVAHDAAAHTGPVSRTVFEIELPYQTPLRPGDQIAGGDGKRTVRIDLLGPSGVRLDDYEDYALQVTSSYPGLPPGDASLIVLTQPGITLFARHSSARRNGVPLEVRTTWDSRAAEIKAEWGQEGEETGRKRVDALSIDVLVGAVNPDDIHESARLRQSDLAYDPESGRVRGRFMFDVTVRPKDGIPVWLELTMRIVTAILGGSALLLLAALLLGVPLRGAVLRMLGR